MPARRKTNSKRYALRKRKNGTRIVQCQKQGRGYLFTSDRKKCASKTFRTKAMAQKELAKMKRQDFGRRKRVTSGFGARKSVLNTNDFGKKKYKIKKYYVVCKDYEEPEKIRVYPAYKVRYDGELMKVVHIRNAYDPSHKFLRLDDSTKLYTDKDKRSGKLKKAKFEGRILNVMGFHPVCYEVAQSLAAAGVAGASGVGGYGSMFSYLGSRQGYSATKRGGKMGISGQEMIDNATGNIPRPPSMGGGGSLFDNKTFNQVQTAYLLDPSGGAMHRRRSPGDLNALEAYSKALSDPMEGYVRRERGSLGRQARTSAYQKLMGGAKNNLNSPDYRMHREAARYLRKKERIADRHSDNDMWLQEAQGNLQYKMSADQFREDRRRSAAEKALEARLAAKAKREESRKQALSKRLEFQDKRMAALNKGTEFGRYRNQPSLMSRARRYRPMSRFGSRMNYGFGYNRYY